eukprot:scaffold190677_cov31-Tisochrysis_lutea.AAC.4
MASADLSAAQLVTGSLLLHRPIPSVRRYAALIKGTESAGFEAFDLSVIQGSTSHTTPILCVQAQSARIVLRNTIREGLTPSHSPSSHCHPLLTGGRGEVSRSAPTEVRFQAVSRYVKAGAR